MGERPIILALANPTPEILPDLVKAVRPDAIIATGRSRIIDTGQQRVLCFPYIFRGALDVGAATINAQMEVACDARDRQTRATRRRSERGRKRAYGLGDART